MVLYLNFLFFTFKRVTKTLGLLTLYNLGYFSTAAAAAQLIQSCPTLCDPIDGSPPGSAVPGILQARVLEWGAIAFSDINDDDFFKSILVPFKVSEPHVSEINQRLDHYQHDI